MKRTLLIVGCTLATAMGSLTFASPAMADGCPFGTVQRFNGVCTSGQGGASAPPAIIAPPQGTGGGPQIVNAPGNFSTVNGIPCNEQHYGTCLALTQNP